MNDKKASRLKAIATDTLGVLCLICAPLLGWLPGPGGVPLLLAGLGLLSLNHEWAKRWLHQLKIHSNSFRKILFPDTKLSKWSWDVVATLLLVASVYTNVESEHWLLSGVSFAGLIGALTIFLFNRNRITKIDRFVRKRK